MDPMLKIVVTGPFSAGKTELIKSVSEIEVVSTERKLTRNGVPGKEETTVAMDYGRTTLKEMTIQLYHHFAMELFIYMPVASSEDGTDHLRLWFHDGAHVTENGVEYLTPPPSEIHLIH